MTIEKIKMGMNYYLKSDECPCCGSTKVNLHIGKQSCGWKFLFRAHIYPPVESYKDWLTLINVPGFNVYDEQDEQMVKEGFLESINHVQSSDLKNVEEGYDNRFYLDEDGYNFCTTEFS